MNADRNLDGPSPGAETGLRPVPAGQVWRWVGPGVVGVVLVGVFFLGLWAASRATAPGSHAIGFAAAGLAVIALGWELKACYDGTLKLSPLVDTAEALVLLVGILAFLGVAGLVLAATNRDLTVASSGFTFFLLGVALIFLNVKHYFDRKDFPSPA